MKNTITKIRNGGKVLQLLAFLLFAALAHAQTVKPSGGIPIDPNDPDYSIKKELWIQENPKEYQLLSGNMYQEPQPQIQAPKPDPQREKLKKQMEEMEYMDERKHQLGEYYSIISWSDYVLLDQLTKDFVDANPSRFLVFTSSFDVLSTVSVQSLDADAAKWKQLSNYPVQDMAPVISSDEPSVGNSTETLVKRVVISKDDFNATAPEKQAYIMAHPELYTVQP